jgi:hypothetical protein
LASQTDPIAGGPAKMSPLERIIPPVLTVAAVEISRIPMSTLVPTTSAKVGVVVNAVWTHWSAPGRTVLDPTQRKSS